MEAEMSYLWEVTAWEFVFVTICLAGGAAYLTGRALARSWQGPIKLFGYMLLLGAATRFIHFALFSGTLLSLYYYVIDLIVITAIAFLGMRITRARQMATQYSFEYKRSGALSWVRKV